MKHTYLMSGVFQTDRPMTDRELAALRRLVCAQIEEPVDMEDQPIIINVDLETIVIIPFNDKVEIIVNPEQLGESE